MMSTQELPFLTDVMTGHMKVACARVTSVFGCNPGQVRASVTQPPAVMEAPATTTAMPFAVPARLVGEGTHATQVRPQDGVYRGSRELMIDDFSYGFTVGGCRV